MLDHVDLREIAANSQQLQFECVLDHKKMLGIGIPHLRWWVLIQVTLSFQDIACICFNGRLN